MDPIGWYIATSHTMLGHDLTAAVLGVPAGDRAACILCKYERGEATREQVIAQIGQPS